RGRVRLVVLEVLRHLLHVGLDRGGLGGGRGGACRRDEGRGDRGETEEQGGQGGGPGLLDDVAHDGLLVSCGREGRLPSLAGQTASRPLEPPLECAWEFWDS